MYKHEFIYIHVIRGQKFHSSARNYEGNLERTSNTSRSTRPLWEELLEGEDENLRVKLAFSGY